MNGTKRFGLPDSNPDTNDSAFRKKRVMEGSSFDVPRIESSQQLTAAPALDMQRAKSSWQHVRALNTQFASWVQAQLKNHPDELWEDGVRDYLAHASNIMEKFSDVVNWLKANAAKGGSLSGAESQTTENKMMPEMKNSGINLSQDKVGFTPSGTTTSLTTSWGAGLSSNSQSSGFTPLSNTTSFSTSLSSVVFSNSQNPVSTPAGSATIFANSFKSGALPNSQNPGSSPVSSTTTFAKPLSSGIFSDSQTYRSSPAGTTTTFGTSFSSGVFPNSQSPAFTAVGTTPSFSNPWNSGVSSNVQTPVLFGGTQSSVTATQSSIPANRDAPDDADENELEQPSSPSVKKAEEKGIIVVHEVKCKLYVKSSDPADKDAWKDRGMGQLYIKCKEGLDKGTKESKPTIIVRNDVGKLLLNALLYPGIKTNLQKNSLVAIFHTSGDNDGNDGGNPSVVARTFLFRTKTEEDRNKLAAAIKEYAPAS